MSAKFFVAAAAVAASTALMASPAKAEDKGVYVLGGLGVSQTDAAGFAMDRGFNSEFGFGYDFGNDIRTEFTWERSDLPSITILGLTLPADASTDSFLLSLYRDFSNDTKLTPFIGAGLGTTGVNDSVNTWSNGFTYAISAGASYEVSDSAELYVKAQYLDASPSSGGVAVDSSAVSAKFGVRYSF